MKRIFLVLTLLFSSLFVRGQNSERPEAIVMPVVSLGSVSETRRQILQNTLIESISTRYRLVPQEQIEEAQEKAFKELEYEECTEDQCILMIQDFLQVENFFVLQVIGEDKDTQISLKWVGLDDKKVKNDYCENCDTKDLNLKVSGIVNELVEVIKSNQPTINKIVKSSKTKEDELRKQKEEALRKRKEEALRKQKEEELRKQKELADKRQKELNFSFRTIGSVNAIDYSLGNNFGVGVLNMNQSIELIDYPNIKEIAKVNGMYFLKFTEQCYYCDSYVWSGIITTGSINYETRQKSLYKYKVNSYLFEIGKQWFWDNNFNITLMGGLIARDYKENGKDITVVNKSDETNIKNFVEQQKSGFYPVILFGYSC